MSRIAVTGASGSLGGQVVRLLAEHTDGDVVALSRRPTAVPPRVTARIADYADGGALRNGLPDVDTLVFLSSDGEGTRVLAHHLNVVAAARACGVTHIVALSGVDADVDSPFCYAVTNGLTEQAIRDSGCGFSIVRASIFAEFFRHFLLPAALFADVGEHAGVGVQLPRVFGGRRLRHVRGGADRAIGHGPDPGLGGRGRDGRGVQRRRSGDLMATTGRTASGQRGQTAADVTLGH